MQNWVGEKSITFLHFSFLNKSVLQNHRCVCMRVCVSRMGRRVWSYNEISSLSSQDVFTVCILPFLCYPYFIDFIFILAFFVSAHPLFQAQLYWWCGRTSFKHCHDTRPATADLFFTALNLKMVDVSTISGRDCCTFIFLQMKLLSLLKLIFSLQLVHNETEVFSVTDLRSRFFETHIFFKYYFWSLSTLLLLPQYKILLNVMKFIFCHL